MKQPKIYNFHTVTTMKEYNAGKWWIDRNIVRYFQIAADSLSEALTKYAGYVEETAYIIISKTALKNKNPMFIDTKDGAVQTGYVITGKTEMQREDYTWSKQYVDLWVDISTNA